MNALKEIMLEVAMCEEKISELQDKKNNALHNLTQTTKHNLPGIKLSNETYSTMIKYNKLVVKLRNSITTDINELIQEEENKKKKLLDP